LVEPSLIFGPSFWTLRTPHSAQARFLYGKGF
jgi:hypothetical protein